MIPSRPVPFFRHSVPRSTRAPGNVVSVGLQAELGDDVLDREARLDRLQQEEVFLGESPQPNGASVPCLDLDQLVRLVVRMEQLNQRRNSFDLTHAVEAIGSPAAMIARSSSVEPSSMASNPRTNSTLERMAACPSSRYGYWSMEYQPS